MAWEPLGWKPAWFSEIDPFCKALLRYHYPEVENIGDFTRIGSDAGAIDLLVGGTPCQDFSVAGLRAGMDGDRGILTLEFLKLAGRLRPTWLVWENVPGILSIDEGRAFGAFLGGLGELGYGFAYRILDAQYFGVPQRRRRVFVVGYLGGWQAPAAVLFERESLQGNPSPCRKAREIIAPTLSARTKSGGGFGSDFDCDGGLILTEDKREIVAALTANGVGTCGADDNQAQAGHLLAYGGNNTSGPIDVASACNAKGGSGRMDFETETFITHSLRTDGHTNAIAFNLRGREGGAMPEMSELASMCSASGGSSGSYVAFPSSQSGVREVETHATLGANNGSRRHNSVVQQMSVRRLTPRECERLQGFPDDWTLVPYRGRPAADSLRYKAVGNSMAVPVMQWIGERINQVEQMSV